MSDSKKPIGGETEIIDPHAVPADAEHIKAHATMYLMIGAALMVLTGLTVGLSFVHFGSESANIVIGMLVAAFKASLVAAIFMHLKEEKTTIYQFMTLTVILVTVLFCLTLLAFADPIRL